MMRRWIGRIVVAGLGAGVLGIVYAALVERARMKLDRFTVTVDKPGLPPEGVTILHLSDFHFGSGGWVQARKITRLRQLLAGESYDLLALTGDLIHDVNGCAAALSLIEQLRPRWGGFSCPGNHDYSEYSVWGVFGHTWRESDAARPPSGSARPPSGAELAGAVRKLWAFGRQVLRNELVRLPVAFNDVPAMQRELAHRGIRSLINQAARVRGVGLDLWVAGVDDLTEGQPDLEIALAAVPAGAPLILLAHNPDIWLDPRVERADLVLAGHTHGGQIRLPVVGVAHTQGTHLTRQRPAGWFQRGATRMFVSRGLGESIPLRFGVPPQAALIRVVCSTHPTHSHASSADRHNAGGRS